MSSGPEIPAILNQNPQTTAALQQAINNSSFLQQQIANYNNAISNQAGSQYQQTTPFGGFNYTQTGTGPNGVPQYSLTQSLNPTTQGLLNQYQANQGVIGSMAPINMGNATNNLQLAGYHLGDYMGMIPGATNTAKQAAGYIPGAQNTIASAQSYIPGAANMVGSGFNTIGSAAQNLGGAYGAINQAQGMIDPAWQTAQSAVSNLPYVNQLFPQVAGMFPQIQEQLTGYSGVDPSAVVGNMTTGNTSNLIKQMTDYYTPFFDQQTKSLDNTLRNQGFAPGTPGYDNAMQNMLKSQDAEVGKAIAQFEPIAYNQAYQNFMTPLAIGTSIGNIAGTLGGLTQNLGNTITTMAQAGQLQSNIASALSNMGMNSAQVSQIMGQLGNMQGNMGNVMGDLASKLSQMGLNQAQVANVLNDIARTEGGLAQVGGGLVNAQTNIGQTQGVLGASQFNSSQPQMPSWMNGPPLNIQNPNLQSANLTGATTAAQQAQLQAFNAQNQQNSNFLSGISGIASNLLPFLLPSDRKLKENIKTVGQLPNGLPVYTYNFIGNDTPQIGLMADEVELIHPEAVVEADGYKLVNYTIAVT